jgi:hypothetical protein
MDRKGATFSGQKKSYKDEQKSSPIPVSYDQNKKGNKKGWRPTLKIGMIMVAGDGFEPSTFGL